MMNILNITTLYCEIISILSEFVKKRAPKDTFRIFQGALHSETALLRLHAI